VTSVGRGGPTESQRRQWAAGLIVLVLTVGTVGYMVLGLTFADAIYQTGITVTTVGFGEITSDGDPTAAYRWFTLGLVLVGASAAVFAAGVMIETMVDQRAGVFREKRMQRQISALRGHVIICGYGRVGQAVARRAHGLGGDIVVIDTSAAKLAECPHPSIVGDATSDDVLRQAGIEYAEALVAGLSSDASNLFLAVSAQQLNADVRIVSRANETANAHKLRAMRLHTVVEPYEMAGARLATAALRPNTSAYLDQVFSTESDQVELTEVEIIESSPLVGCTVVETESRHGVVVVAHRPTGGHEFSSPRSFEGVLGTGDIIIVLGDRQSIAGVQGRGGRSG
jgi:voltage-gated potassium channel